MINLSQVLLLDNKLTQFIRILVKCFDRVILKQGIGGRLLCWLTICIEEHYLSYEFEATSGVPHGSHVGPILLFFSKTYCLILNLKKKKPLPGR